MKNVTQNVFGDKDESMHCFDDSTADVGSDCESVFKQKGLHFIHINAKSLLPKMEEVGHLVLTSKAAMIAVSETWLDCSIQDAEIELTGYSIDRSINKGGVCLLSYRFLNQNLLLKVFAIDHLSKQNFMSSLKLSVVRAMYAWRMNVVSWVI